MVTHFSLPSPSRTFVNRVACAVTSLCYVITTLKQERLRQMNIMQTGLRTLADLPWPWGSLLVLQARKDSFCQVTSPEKQLPWPLPI